MTLIVGDYVKIKNNKFHAGEIGKLEGYDGFMYYKVKLLKTDQIVECALDEIEKIDDLEETESSFYFFQINEEVDLKLKNRNLKYKCEVLESNPFLHGLYALGKYYSYSNFPELHEKSYLSQLIIKLKNFDEKSAKEVFKIFIYYMDHFSDLKNLIDSVHYTIMMPTLNPYNHVAVWGSWLTEHLHKQDISKFIQINPNRRDDLQYYKKKNPYTRSKIMDNAFLFQGDNKLLQEKNVLILDDICTTGNQINAMTNLLAENGVKKVIALVIGRTKSPYMN